MTSHPGIGKIVFAGSTATAKRIMAKTSGNLKRLALAMRLECGTAWGNEHGAIQPDAPFGGIRQSGMGVKFVQHGLAKYT